MLEILLYFLIYWVIGIIVIYILTSNKKEQKYEPESGWPIVWGIGPFIYPLLLLSFLINKIKF